MSRPPGPSLAKTIVCYGDVIDDIVVRPAGAIRADTDTPSAISMRPGGSAANTAAWLGSVGSPAALVGVVGKGDAKRHRAELPGVECFLREHPSLPTGRIVIIVEGERRHMLTDRGANVALGPDDVSDSLLERTGLLHLTGHVLLDDAGPKGARELIARCRRTGVRVSVSPGSAGFIRDVGVETVLRAFAGADLIFTSEEDGQLLTGETTSGDVAAALGRQFGRALLTRGSNGALLANRGDVTGFDIVPRPVVDPTGAGDAFCAGFLDRWVNDAGAREATQAGLELAARAVGIVGGRPA